MDQTITKQDNVHYVKCENEKDLLKQFLKFWQSYTPDVITLIIVNILICLI